MRIRERVVSAFDDGQQRKLERQAALFELLRDERQVELRAREYPRQVIRVFHVPVALSADATVIRRLQRKAPAELREQIVGSRRAVGLQREPVDG